MHYHPVIPVLQDSLKDMWTQVKSVQAKIQPFVTNATDGVNMICYSQGVCPYTYSGINSLCIALPSYNCVLGCRGDAAARHSVCQWLNTFMLTELVQFGWGSSREENHSYLHAGVLGEYIGCRMTKYANQSVLFVHI